MDKEYNILPYQVIHKATLFIFFKNKIIQIIINFNQTCKIGLISIVGFLFKSLFQKHKISNERL